MEVHPLIWACFRRGWRG